MSEIPAYVGMQRLCKETGFSDDTIRRRMKDAGFPQPKPSGKWKWKEVEKWMDGDRQAPLALQGDDQLKEIENASAAYHSTHH